MTQTHLLSNEVMRAMADGPRNRVADCRRADPAAALLQKIAKPLELSTQGLSCLSGTGEFNASTLYNRRACREAMRV